MSEEIEFKPVNQEKDSRFNAEPGIVVIPGSNYANEMQKFEQFPSKYGGSPGNPYRYKPFPKMLYRAENYKGKACCMAAPPDPHDFADPREYERADEGARRYSEKCQKIVGNEQEMSRAMEDGWRESPDAAVTYLLGKDKAKSTDTAHRNYEDRGMSDAAKAEAKRATEEAGEHLPAIPEAPRVKRKYTRRAKPAE